MMPWMVFSTTVMKKRRKRTGETRTLIDDLRHSSDELVDQVLDELNIGVMRQIPGKLPMTKSKNIV